ncbi:MAG TPA: NAD(P)-dependent alcohol dehydrogenase [Bryobacteraceae bacterium]|nr:NAD(P)-dependent alcohol dehydrogenase [Bryobacteraceae bacterium]
MQAVVFHRYGSPDVVELRELDRPVAGDGEVLVRVRAASVNALDWRVTTGRPYFVRMMEGLPKPKNPRLGVDLAGQIEAVGRNVTRFQPGDEVFGAQRGAFAEYVCAPEEALALKPANLTFEQAAAVPVAGLTALQGLRDKGRVQPGHNVLINGASGGVGTFAVQIAKSLGANVTAVCSSRNVAMVRSLGADQVIDYRQEDFTRSGQRYDLIFDVAGNRSLSACRRVMSARGTYVAVGGPDGRWIGPAAPLLKALLLSRFVSQNLVPFVSALSQADLVVLKELIEANQVTPVIERCYPLSEVAEAIRYLETGHARAKVVITLSEGVQKLPAPKTIE